jgi:hypothetical protein
LSKKVLICLGLGGRERGVGTGSVYLPGNVGGVEDGQALVVLQVGDAQVLFEADDFRIADVGAVEKGAEEEQGQDGEDSKG